MKQSLFSPPDPFTLSPMITLLPVIGSIDKLEALTSSLYARYEKVQNLQKEIPAGQGPGGSRRPSAEAAMLKQVLDWLSVKPERADKKEGGV
jgi:hypothetical protein